MNKDIINKIQFEENIRHKIKFIDFYNLYPNLYLDNSLSLNEIYKEYDPASHLSEKANLIFVSEILKRF